MCRCPVKVTSTISPDVSIRQGTLSRMASYTANAEEMRKFWSQQNLADQTISTIVIFINYTVNIGNVSLVPYQH